MLETVTVEDPREKKDGVSLVEELIHAALSLGFPDLLVSIGSLLNLELQEKLV